MTRDQKAETARRNGSRSKGPKTPAGKAASSRNSLKHGRYASTAVLAAVDRAVAEFEDSARFRQLLRHNLQHFQPTSACERETVIALAGAQWRLERWNLAETKSLNEYRREAEENYQDNLADGFQTEISVAEVDARATRRLACNTPFLSRITSERARLIRECGAHLRLLRALRSEFPKPVKKRPERTKERTKERTQEDLLQPILTC